MFNVIILCIAQFFAACGHVSLVVLAGIIGAQLAGDPRLATLPVSFGVIGIAITTAPAALAMPRLGRRRVFILGALMAAAGAGLAILAMQVASFWLYCAANLLMGANLAFTAQFRFAAAESVAPELVSRVVAWVMLGTVFAASFAPRLIVAARHLTDTDYAASFALMSLAYLCSAITLAFLRNPPVISAEANVGGRSLREIARQSNFRIAVLAAAIGYGVMALIMTATPLSMHVLMGHSVEATAAVVQGHVLAMYLPSLISGWLVAKLGVARMLVVGTICEAICVVFAISGNAVLHYGAAMVSLGIGWNLMFVAGTTLLTRCYEPNERFRAQASNEFTMFGVMALASLLAGVMITSLGWRGMNLLALLPLAALLTLIVFNPKIAQRPQGSGAA